jgi:predicted dehydrogenase
MKVLIIGLGSIGKKHLKEIQTYDPGIEIFALRSNSNAEKYSHVTDVYNLNEIERLYIDFAIVSNPTSEHKNTISQLEQFRIPLFIEKPLYFSLEIEALVNSIASSGIKSYVACNLRFLDCIRFIKDQLSQIFPKRLNEVNVYCGSYLPDWRPGVDFRKSYSSLVGLGGGVHLDLIHELDYLYWIFGNPIMVKRNLRSKSSLSIPTYDYANYLLDYNGFSANVVLNYYRKDPKRSFELVFEDETWNVDLLNNQITSNGKKMFSSEQRIADTYKIQMDYFINCLTSKGDTFNTITDAYNVLRIALDDDITR